MIRKNRLQCWALRQKNGALVGRKGREWYEAYKVLTFRTRVAAKEYMEATYIPMKCEPVKIRIETYVED